MRLETRVEGRSIQRATGMGMACVAVVSCLMAHGSYLVAEAAELKVGSVDVAKVFDGYQRTRASDATLEKKGKEKETEFEGRMNELKKLRQNLELLNNDAREAKTKEIEEKSEELQRFRTNTARDLSRERDKIASELLREIQKSIEDYAKTNGFSLIFDARSVLYGQEAHDVTDEVLATLNKRTAVPAH